MPCHTPDSTPEERLSDSQRFASVLLAEGRAAVAAERQRTDEMVSVYNETVTAACAMAFIMEVADPNLLADSPAHVRDWVATHRLVDKWRENARSAPSDAVRYKAEDCEVEAAKFLFESFGLEMLARMPGGQRRLLVNEAIAKHEKELMDVGISRVQADEHEQLDLVISQLYSVYRFKNPGADWRNP